MERSDLRRADALHDFWDDVALGRAPADPQAIDGDVAALIERLQALGDLPELDSARDRVWRNLEQHALWKEPDVNASTFSLNAATGPPPLAHPLEWPRTISPSVPGWRMRPLWPLAQAAAVLLIVASIVVAYFSVFRQGEEPTNLAPAVATPGPDATPATGVPIYRGNPARTGEMSGPGPQGQPAELWRFQTGGGVQSAPAIAEETLYVGSDDGHLYALDAITGEERWRFAAGDAVGSSPTVADGLVYVGSNDGTLYALDAVSGSETWRFATEGVVTIAPLVADGVVYIGGDEESLYALDAATGKEVWSSPLGAVPARSAALADGMVYIGSRDGAFHAIEAASGEDRWRVETGNVEGTMSTPTVAGGVVYEVVFNGPVPATLYAFDTATGEERWRAQVPEEIRGAVGVADGVVYAGSNAGVLLTLDAATGAERWRFAADDMIDGAPAIVGNTIYVASLDRNIYALDASNGAEQWRYAIDGASSWGPVANGGVLYLGDAFGIVYAIAGSDAGADPSTLPAPGGLAGASPAAGTPIAGQSMELLWQTDGGADPLIAPAGAAIDAEGNLWVTDGGNDRIAIFAPDGTFLEHWDGTAGGGEGFEFEKANGSPDADLAFDPQGNVYVMDTGNLRVQKFDADRQFVTAWGGFGTDDGKFVGAYSLAVDSMGNVSVSDFERGDVQVFDADGRFLRKFNGAGGEDMLADPSYMTVDAENQLWVVDESNDRVVVFDQDGNFLQAFGHSEPGPGQIQFPTDVAVDADGVVFVVDYEGGDIQVFDATGVYPAVLSPGAGPDGAPVLPYAIALDGAGALYVIGESSLTQGAGAVQKFRLPPRS